LCRSDCDGAVDVFALADVGYVFLFYLISLAVRVLVIAACSPVLRRLGDGVEVHSLHSLHSLTSPRLRLRQVCAMLESNGSLTAL
jgi:hypothetical protein